MSGLLDGIKVVEMGTYIVVPKAARIMADWGASVVKVELPGGEFWRKYGGEIGLPGGDENNVFFQSENMNKRCISLDMKQEEGRAVMYKLLEDADVFMVNTRPTSLKKIGLDYESLQKKFPRLIYANFCGYGEEGPENAKAGYDVTAYWSRNGALYSWALKENMPFKPRPGYGDSTTAPMLLSGILAALYNREKTGKGDKILGSLLSAGMFFNSTDLVYAQFVPRETYPLSRFNLGPSNTVYRTADNEFVHFSLAGWQHRYHILLEALKMEQYIGDPRFLTVKDTLINSREIVPLFDEAFSKMTADEVLKALEDRDIICSKLTHPQDVCKDEQAWANGYLREMELGCNTKVTLPNTPLKFDSMPDIPFNEAPLLGEHSIEILKQLGCDDAEIQDMLEKKAVLQYEKKETE